MERGAGVVARVTEQSLWFGIGPFELRLSALNSYIIAIFISVARSDVTRSLSGSMDDTVSLSWLDSPVRNTSLVSCRGFAARNKNVICAWFVGNHGPHG
jgi:hypothetical protein